MSKRARIILTSVLVIVSLVVVFASGFLAGRLVPATSSHGFDSLVQAWDIITRNYVEASSLDRIALADAGIKAMVDSLADPHTAYLDPAAYQATQSNFAGTYGGIGATSSINGSDITLKPIAGSPAEKAGIRAGDVLLEVDGQSVVGKSLSEVTALIRGDAGTSVKLLVRHPGETQTSLITVVRAEITLPSVSLEMRGHIAIITITSFSAKTDEELTPVVAGLAQAGTTGIVLDLRGNPGGLVDTVVAVASHFITDGTVLSIVDNAGNKQVLNVTHQTATTSLPMVVLVDQDSASGSEVLSGALQDHKRALIAGTVTYGKGSVDQLYGLRDGSGIYLTIARWYTPNGNLIEGQGIMPDVVLTTTGEAELQWAIDHLETSG